MNGNGLDLYGFTMNNELNFTQPISFINNKLIGTNGKTKKYILIFLFLKKIIKDDVALFNLYDFTFEASSGIFFNSDIIFNGNNFSN